MSIIIEIWNQVIGQKMIEPFKIALSQYDLQEWSGPSHNPEVMKFFEDFPHVTTDETSWCLKGDTELLTDKGFIRLDEAVFKTNQEFKVAYLNTTNNSVEYTDKFNWIIKQYKGELYNINKASINVSCDPSHEFYGKWSSSGKYLKRKISTITKYGVAIPPISSSCDDYSISDDDLILLAAFLSDGHKSFNRINIGVSKEHKIKILSTLNPVWIKKGNRGVGNRKIRTNFSFIYPDIFREILSEYKVMKWEFINKLSKRQCKLFVDSYSYFDGTRNDNAYSLFTACDKLAENLIYIAIMAGYKATLSKIKQVSKNTTIDYINTIYVATKNRHKYIMKNHIKKSYYDGILYCVQVPSGVFIIRDRNKNIIPIGNCSAFVYWCIKEAGMVPKKSLVARDWLSWGVQVFEPEIGDLAIFYRGEPGGWQGHVAFYVKNDGTNVWVLGGNQSNRVSIEKYAGSKLLGYRRYK